MLFRLSFLVLRLEQIIGNVLIVCDKARASLASYIIKRVDAFELLVQAFRLFVEFFLLTIVTRLTMPRQ